MSKKLVGSVNRVTVAALRVIAGASGEGLQHKPCSKTNASVESSGLTGSRRERQPGRTQVASDRARRLAIRLRLGVVRVAGRSLASRSAAAAPQAASRRVRRTRTRYLSALVRVHDIGRVGRRGAGGVRGGGRAACATAHIKRNKIALQTRTTAEAAGGMEQKAPQVNKENSATEGSAMMNTPHTAHSSEH